jgi:hypothetical protein
LIFAIDDVDGIGHLPGQAFPELGFQGEGELRAYIGVRMFIHPMFYHMRGRTEVLCISEVFA